MRISLKKLPSGMLEGRPAGQHLVEGDPQAVDVGAAVVGLVEEPFGRHVGGGADAVAVERQLLRQLGVADQLGDAEVEHLDHLDALALVQEDVLRLDVAVDDAQARGRPRAPRRAAAGSPGSARASRLVPAVQLLVEGVAVEQLHHQENARRFRRSRSRAR